jgi:hypothetical protein
MINGCCVVVFELLIALDGVIWSEEFALLVVGTESAR